MEAAFLGSLRRLSELLAKTPDLVVAEIGDQSITRADVAEALANLPPTNGKRTLQSAYRDAIRGLIVQRALVIRAREAGIDKDPAIQRRIAAATDTILSTEYLRRSASAVVTDAMLHNAYDRDIANQPGLEAVRARIIMVQTPQEAADVQAALAGGMDFSQAAMKFSQDATAQVGGDLGYVRIGSVLPEIGAVIFSLAPGQTTAYPVQAGGALYLVKVESRRQQGPPSFEAVRGQLAQQLARDAVPQVVDKALAGLVVNDYGIMGKNAAASTPAATSSRRGSPGSR